MGIVQQLRTRGPGVPMALLLCALGLAFGAVVRVQADKPAQLALPVFDDHFAAGWENYSWGSEVNLQATAPRTDTGADSRAAIAFDVTEPYGALRLHSDDAIDTRSFAALQLVARATGPGEFFTVVLYDDNGERIGQPVPLTRYGGDPTVDNWKTYSIPLGAQDLDTGSGKVRDIVIQADYARTEPTLYVSHLGFVTTQGLKEAQSTTAAPVTQAASQPKSEPLIGSNGNRLLVGLAIGAVALAALTTVVGLRRRTA